MPVKNGEQFKVQCSLNSGGPGHLSIPKPVADYFGITKGQWLTITVTDTGLRIDLPPAQRSDDDDPFSDDPTDPDIFDNGQQR